MPDSNDSKTQAAFDAAFKAMSDWRDELRALTELHGQRTFDRLGEAVRLSGWPDNLIDMTKTQLLEASKMQAEMIDHMMNAWQEQMKSPGGPAKLMSSLSQSAAQPQAQTAPMAELAMAPAQFWMQATTMWQKSWTEALSSWSSRRDKDEGGRS